MTQNVYKKLPRARVSARTPPEVRNYDGGKTAKQQLKKKIKQKSHFGHPFIVISQLSPFFYARHRVVATKTVSKHAEQMGRLKGGKARLPVTFVTIRLW